METVLMPLVWIWATHPVQGPSSERRPVNGEGDDLADHDRVASVGQLERRHVVPFVRVVVGVHESLPHVGPQHPLAADGVVGIRALPARIESRRAGPGAHEHVVLAVLGFQDLAVPIVELRGNGRALGTLDAVAYVARQHARHAPRGRAERRADDGGRLDVVEERLRLCDLRDAEAQTGQQDGHGDPATSVGRSHRGPRQGLGRSSNMHTKCCPDARPIVRFFATLPDENNTGRFNAQLRAGAVRAIALASRNRAPVSSAARPP